MNLFHQHREALARLREQFRSVPPGPAEVERLAQEWAWAADHTETELLALCDLDGRITGTLAPRWLAHLLGFPHATAHVGLVTASGLVVLQRRSRTKAQFPDTWDMTVTGHVSFPVGTTPAGISYDEAAARELEEEMGLPGATLGETLADGRLHPIGQPVPYFGESGPEGRPWRDIEVRQLFGGVLTAPGMAALQYPEEEISGILLCRPAEALRQLEGPEGAAGARASMREFTAWLQGRLA